MNKKWLCLIPVVVLLPGVWNPLSQIMNSLSVRLGNMTEFLTQNAMIVGIVVFLIIIYIGRKG